MIQAEAFLWVLTHPGPSLSLQDFNDWYDQEHVPLRMSSLPEFITGARYEASDQQLPQFSAFYNVKSLDLFKESRYTNLRTHRSQTETQILQRIAHLDRRTYRILTNSIDLITDRFYSPWVITLELKDLTHHLITSFQHALQHHPACLGIQTCEIIDHSVIGIQQITGDSESQDQRVSTYLIKLDFQDTSFESLSIFENLIRDQDIKLRKWALKRGWQNTAPR